MAAGGERFNVNTSLSKNWEHLQNKFLGTGHPDISRHELAAALDAEKFIAHADFEARASVPA